MDLQIIQNKIFEVRGCRVMLDYHLAELYQVETRALKQAVKRNIERFPSDFMFVLTKEEANLLLSIGVSDRKSTRLNSSHANISYAVFCLKKKNKTNLRSL